MIDLQRYWWPLALLTELESGKPVARTLHGVPLVLFRDANNQPAVLHDRCPHRHAPLSCGQVRSGEITCPYHGWRFAADGRCTDVPGFDFAVGTKRLLSALAVRVEHGLIWACTALDETTPAPVAPAVVKDVDYFYMTDTVQSGLAEAAENFLDGFHTHFVHAGLIRRDSKRQTVKAEVRRLDDGVEARYSEEGLQSGLISSLLEGSRTESMGRFRLPGVAEIEYRGRHGLNLLITAWLTPETHECLRIHARVATRRAVTPAWLKRVVLRRLFGHILYQDKSILEATELNVSRFENAGLAEQVLNTDLDLLGPAIRRLLQGQLLEQTVDRTQICRL